MISVSEVRSIFHKNDNGSEELELLCIIKQGGYYGNRHLREVS